MIRSHTSRKLSQSGRAAKALRAIEALSIGKLAMETVSVKAIQTQMADDALTAMSGAQFYKAVLRRPLAQSLIANPSPGKYRLTGEGLHMLKRLDAEAAMADNLAAPKAKRKPTPARQAKIAAAIKQAANGPVVPPNTTPRLAGRYDKDECNFKHVRPGAMDFADLPSRRGNMLVYRDGRQEPITHGFKAASRPRPAQIDLQPVVAKVATPAANDASTSGRSRKVKAA